jgi:hypothetical protein
MPNPLWVDARDYLTNKGVPVTTGNLNSAVTYLGQNPDARLSYAKASPDAATSIGAGLGMPTDDLARPVQDTNYLSLGQHVPNRASSNPEPRGSVSSPIPQATPLPPNANPAIPDVSNGAYAPGGLELGDAGLGTAAAAGGGLGAALLAMILSRGRGGRLPNAPRIPGVGASPLETRLPPGSPPPITGPTPITGPAPITGPLPTGSPPPVYTPPPIMGPPPVRPAPPIRGPQPVSGTMEDILTAQKPKPQAPPPKPTAKAATKKKAAKK